MHLRGFIFDLDGTLLDTLDDLALAMNAVLDDAGYATHPREAYKHFAGDGIANLVRRALPPETGDERMVDRMVKAMTVTYTGQWGHHDRPYEGVPELLDALAARSVPHGVLSNKPHDFVVPMVQRLLRHGHLSPAWGVRVEYPRKPDPAAALAIAELWQIPAEVIGFVGDTATDMATANAAGMVAIGAGWGFRTTEELRTHGAVVIVDKPMEILSFIKNA